MKKFTFSVDDVIHDGAQEYASYHGTTLEALVVEYLAELAEIGGRRLTLREQIYRDYKPPAEVVEQLRLEARSKRSGR